MSRASIGLDVDKDGSEDQPSSLGDANGEGGVNRKDELKPAETGRDGIPGTSSSKERKRTGQVGGIRGGDVVEKDISSANKGVHTGLRQ